MYSERPARTFRRFTLGLALAVLALMFAPSMVEQYAAQAPRQVVRESAAATVAPDAAAQDAAPQAPAAFSDALAAAPAGAQCSVEAHTCSVPTAANEAAMSSGETALAYDMSQTMRGAHNQRM